MVVEHVRDWGEAGLVLDSIPDAMVLRPHLYEYITD